MFANGSFIHQFNKLTRSQRFTAAVYGIAGGVTSPEIGHVEPVARLFVLRYLFGPLVLFGKNLVLGATHSGSDLFEFVPEFDGLDRFLGKQEQMHTAGFGHTGDQGQVHIFN